MADNNEVAQAVADFLFRDGTHCQADRLLLITEDYSGKAKVTDAHYLGGWSKAAVVDAVSQILKANQISPSYFEQLIRLREAAEVAHKYLVGVSMTETGHNADRAREIADQIALAQRPTGEQS